jgi:hypothetical protein
MSTQSSRRELLQAFAAAISSLFLPKSLRAENLDEPFWFLHVDTGNSWPVTNPVIWSLDNARQPILERASAGLLRLTPDDGDRIIRLVIRRCRLNLLELHPGRVVVHHWGEHGQADLRQFFKMHGLARKEIEVFVSERKREIAVVRPGDDFLFGLRLDDGFPMDLYLSKWQGRFQKQPDDWSAAPGTWSGFAWHGIENNRIPWAALKSAWRRPSQILCLNCSALTILVNFGYQQTGMFSRSPRFVYVCGACYRSFRDESVTDTGKWIFANLDVELQPGFEMVWNRRVLWEPKG